MTSESNYHWHLSKDKKKGNVFMENKQSLKYCHSWWFRLHCIYSKIIDLKRARNILLEDVMFEIDERTHYFIYRHGIEKWLTDFNL